MSRKLDYTVDGHNKVWYEDVYMGEIVWNDLLEQFEFSYCTENSSGLDVDDLLQIAFLVSTQRTRGGY